MPPYEPKARQTRLSHGFSEPRIVLAIDYGTTFTGLAWMQTDGESAPQFSDLNLFVDWPGKNEVKVPSEVSYSLTTTDTHDREYHKWGYSMDQFDPKSKVLRWTKLKLVKDPSPLGELEILRGLIDGLAEMNKLYSEGLETSDVPRHLSRTSKDIIEFYLSNVAREWVTYIENQASVVLDVVPVDIVVTHPAMWPDDARSTLLQAVCGAFNKVTIPTRRNVHITSEPEACTLYVIQDVIRKNSRSLQIGDCFTLCDAGGGTIIFIVKRDIGLRSFVDVRSLTSRFRAKDLVSYYLDNLNPLRLIRVGNVSGKSAIRSVRAIVGLIRKTGAPIGATTVDRAFLRWLGSKLRNLDIDPEEYGKGGHYILTKIANTLLNRFEVFKRSFTGSESYDLILPKDAEIIKAEDDSEARQFHISSDEMKEMFRESIDGVKKLIIQQVIRVEQEPQQGLRCRVSNIFLAGGFAESEYLYNEVKKTARRFANIQVRRADDCWSSVVKGAVLSGMAIGAQLPPKIVICPRRYGLSLNGSGQHAPEEGGWTIDPLYENSFLPGQLIWLVERGDVIFADSQLKKTIKLCFKAQELGKSTTMTFVANGFDNAPCWLEDLTTRYDAGQSLVEDLTVRMDRLLPTDFRRCKFLDAKGKKKTSYELSVDVELTVKYAIIIEVKHRGQVIATHTTTSL